MKLVSLFAAIVAMNMTDVDEKGDTAHKGHPKFFVAIELTNGEKTWHKCGGVLLFKEWVVTTANCTAAERANDLHVATGRTHDINSNVQIIPVHRIYRHEEFRHYTLPLENDIALIHLKKPAILDAYTTTAFINHNFMFREPCTEVSWVINNDTEPACEISTVDLCTPRVCRNHVKRRTQNNDLCATPNYKRLDISKGGPLLCYQKSVKAQVLVGLVSARKISGYTYYVNLKYYLCWIRDTILRYCGHAKSCIPKEVDTICPEITTTTTTTCRPPLRPITTTTTTPPTTTSTTTTKKPKCRSKTVTECEFFENSEVETTPYSFWGQ